LVLNTSISEGFPYAVIEAMASGRCVVATDVGGVEEAVGDAGVLVAPLSPEAVAAACVDLLGNDERRHALGAAARERVRSMFTVQQSNDAYRQLYDELLVPTMGSGAESPPLFSAGEASREYERAS
jgi:glycosyltransferase involved in cell wall biosynthesis